MKQAFSFFFTALLVFVVSGCGVGSPPSSDEKQQAEQERILQEGTSSVGMPNIKNFREKRMMKDILEMRDQTDFVTYAYLYNDYNGCVVYVGQGIGYPIPYSTQYTSPQKIAEKGHQYGYAITPQADPNGLFSPPSSEATWYLMKDPNSDALGVQYLEPRMMVTPFKYPKGLECSNRSAYANPESRAAVSEETAPAQEYPKAPAIRPRPRY